MSRGRPAPCCCGPGRPFGGSRPCGRPARRPVGERDLCSGPAKLCQALGIDGTFDGVDLLDGAVALLDDGTAPPGAPDRTTRIGLSRGADLPWRWAVPGDPNVSRHR